MIPDFIGLTPDEAIRIIESKHPNVSCNICIYSPPQREGQNVEVVFRIIRQRQTGVNQLEFIISPFIHNK